MVSVDCQEWRRELGLLRARRAEEGARLRAVLATQVWPEEKIGPVADEFQSFLSSERGHLAMDILRTLGEFIHLASTYGEGAQEYILTGKGLRVVSGERDALKRVLLSRRERVDFRCLSCTVADVVLAAARDPRAQSPDTFLEEVIRQVDEAAQSANPPVHQAF